MMSTPSDDPDRGLSDLVRFEAFLRARLGRRFADYADLQRWSTSELDAFWLAVWDFYELPSDSSPVHAIDAEAEMPGATWFPGVVTNYVSAVFRHARTGVAVIEVLEDGSERTVSWSELRRQVASMASVLRSLGVSRGDRVVGYLPNTTPAIVGFLATASLGAIWSVCGQDYSARGAADRLSQLEPVVLFAADGYRFKGVAIDRRDEVAELIDAMPTLRAVVDVRNIGTAVPDTPGVSRIGFDVATSGTAEFVVEPVDFSAPLWVLFTSGTTGAPKGLVHGHGGVMLEHAVVLGLQSDLRAGDRLFWYTNTNWMMWNLVVSALILGASTVVYDGSPVHPDPAVLWDIVGRHGITLFGTSPGHLLASERARVRLTDGRDLGALRAVGSTGAALPESSFQWLRREVGSHVQIASSSGGTDIVGGFVGPAPTLPDYPGEISCVYLGAALDSWDDEGKPVRERVGELVITKPIPSMPLFFWNDPDGRRYRDAYLSTFPGVWRHGDWITLTERGSVIMHGRSDATLNRNGIRLGSAEIYEVVEGLPEVEEALIVGVEGKSGDYWMPLFIVPAGGEWSERIAERIAAAIRSSLSPRHVPDEIIPVPLLPHTRTGKKIEVPVKRLLQGAEPDDVVNPSAVDRPEALDFFIRLARQRTGGARTRAD